MNAPLRRTSGISLHRQLFVILREQILRGVYERGAPIPTEDELIVEFGVSRNTVRRAVADLELQGLLEKRQGRGTFVSELVPARRPSATLTFMQMMRQHAANTVVALVTVGVDVPPSDIGAQLDLLDGVPAFRVLRLRRSGSTPVLLSDSWLPAPIGAKLSKRDLRKKPLYELLIANGVVFERVVQEITAVPANPIAAKYLDSEPGSPMVKITRLLYDADARPVQHMTVFFAPERSRLLMEMSIGNRPAILGGQILHDVGKNSALDAYFD